MAKQTWTVVLSTLMFVFGGAEVARAAERDPIPVILVAPTNPAQTPDPVCSLCAIVVKPTNTSNTTTTTVTLNHDGDFEGDVELVVWLDSEERESVWISDVSIVDGEALELEVEAGEGWSWDEVQFAWTRLHRAL
jgi:hypothetical protein